MRVIRQTVLILPLLLAGCTFGVPIGDRSTSQSYPSQSTKSSPGNPPSYVVFGKRYYVMDSGRTEGFVQRGIASWYGTKFHGRRTSSGEVYNMHDMTAAHKTLPIPVYVHVRNLDNNRSAIVRVNDRGPFIDGRIIDLSYAAAKKLGVDGPGTANVEISVIEQGQTEPARVVRAIPLTPPEELDQPLFIQMGSFSSLGNAETLMRDLHAANESSARVTTLDTDNGRFYRVRLGPLYDIDEANAILARLRTKGFQSPRIVVQD